MAVGLTFVVVASAPAREVPAPTPTVTIVASAATVAPAVTASLVPWYPAPSYAAPVPTLTPTPLPTPSTPTVAQARAWAMRTLGRTQYTCLSWIVQAESRWDPRAWNRKGSGAYGLAQAKPASRMATPESVTALHAKRGSSGHGTAGGECLQTLSDGARLRAHSLTRRSHGI
jgi:hypothetical protein